ncbi:E3 ubiquitin-protein ligase UBR1 [Thelohanellus kitauei]|uniref:E3 ubiquitin-protein ligase n=1 Tax=Thelohanellus kitauei TaxID=669202 RepID=A0A0C2M5K9_THEKT|nr:E3 ubiquitin-protein ligase UBR1 [Thelohanellus kitauei]
MDEIKRRIDNIFINGLLVTTNESGKHVNQLFSNARLETLVGARLKEFIFEEHGPAVKAWFYSDFGALEMCTKVFKPGENVYTCIDCQKNGTCTMCYDCFQHSEHVHHKNKNWKSNKPDTT